ncbi:MAG: efflux RND transporter periplasmic adaptor subunit [Smithella sp.]
MKKKIIIAIFVLLFIGTGIFVYLGQKKNNKNEMFFSGTIETTNSNLSFQVSGRVIAVNAQEGQTVAKDQVIAELDPTELQSRYDQAKANLDRAIKTKKQLETVLHISKNTLPQEVSRAAANVRSAQDTMQDAEKNYRRYAELFRKNVVTEKERDAVKLTYDVAKSRLTEAQSAMRLAQGNLSRIEAAGQDIETSTAQIDLTRAALVQAATQLDYTKLRSPINGTVISRNVEPGETVTPGREVMTISDISRVDLKIFVDETQIGKVKPGQKAEAKVDTFPNKVFTGFVSFISPEGEFTPKIIQTQKERVKLVYLVKISIANPTSELKAGMPADARLQ